MGALTTNAYYSPANFLHVVLDNNVHESTGSQLTVSSAINFVALAAASSYTNSWYAHSIDELESFLEEWKKNPALSFLYLKIAKGKKDNLGRPNVKPYEVKERLMNFIRECQ